MQHEQELQSAREKLEIKVVERFLFPLLVQVDWDGWGYHDRTHPVLLISGLLFGEHADLLW
jgi:hypothetical protein